METLDKCFENVCELDLIFHVDKVSIIPFSMLNSAEHEIYFDHKC